jgi:predicted metal-dependent hydrolase
MPIHIDRLIRSRRKTIALIVRPDGSLEVRAPQQMAESRIREFVESHAEWVRKQKARASDFPQPLPKQFADGEKFPYLGKEYPLRIVPRQRQALTFDGVEFRLTKSALPKAREAFIRWYKAQAAQVLSERITAQATAHVYKYDRIRITSARTRWGSCSTRGTLSFTYRLIMAPSSVVDYVILHELVHLKIKNHSRDFWGQLGKLMPDYKKYVTWLKKNGKYLTIE